jgi:WD40 repeat protein
MKYKQNNISLCMMSYTLYLKIRYTPLLEENFLLLFIVTSHEEFLLHFLNYSSSSLLASFYLFQADLLQFSIDGERPKFIKIGSYGRHFVYLCFTNPSGDHIATLNASGYINIWAVNTGKLVCMKRFF